MTVTLFISVICLQAASAPRLAKPRPATKRRLTADLLGNARKVALQLDTTSRTPVTVVDAGRKIAIDIKGRWKPWAIATADLIGDGRREIVVALYKSTRYMPEPHNCLFVYRYNGREVYPLWLGSSLGRPFSEFVFARSANSRAERLVTLDSWMDGRKGITVHHWTGFGFQKEQSWGNWKNARNLSVQDWRPEIARPTYTDAQDDTRRPAPRKTRADDTRYFGAGRITVFADGARLTRSLEEK